MASDQAEVIAIPSVLARLVRHCCSCQSGYAQLSSIPPCPSKGHDGEVVHLSSVVWLRWEEGVVDDLGLNAWSSVLGLACPLLFGLFAS
jgi:hypothetical protein